MSNTIDFTSELKKIIGCSLNSGERPFVCDGYPATCHVMVVGQNPATNLSEDWWSFWDTEYGFKESSFESAYEKHRGKDSDTRGKFLNRITCNLKPELKSLETNASMGGGTSRSSNQEVLKLLLKEMHNLQAIIAYGNNAHKLVGQHGRLQPFINLPDDAIYEIYHFKSRHPITDFERIAEIDRICAEIKRNFNLSE